MRHVMAGSRPPMMGQYAPHARPSITAGTGQPRPQLSANRMPGPGGHMTTGPTPPQFRGQKPVQPVHPATINMKPAQMSPHDVPLKPGMMPRHMRPAAGNMFLYLKCIGFATFSSSSSLSLFSAGVKILTLPRCIY